MERSSILQLSKIFKIVAVLMAIAFVVVAIFSLSIRMNMHQDHTTGCIFDQSAECTMSPAEHIAQWKRTFTATQPSNDILLSVIILLAGIGMISSFLRYCDHYFKLRFDSSKIHKEKNSLAKLFDPVLQALSAGRLNPKIYALSYIAH